MEGTTLEAGEGSGEQEARVPRAPLPEPESLSDDSRTCRPGGCHFEDSRLLRPTTAGRRTGACASTIRGQAKLRYGTVICRLVCAPQPVRVRQTGRRYSWIWFQSNVLPGHSVRTVDTHNSTCAFAFGARGGILMAWMPAANRTAADVPARVSRPGYLPAEHHQTDAAASPTGPRSR